MRGIFFIGVYLNMNFRHLKFLILLPVSVMFLNHACKTTSGCPEATHKISDLSIEDKSKFPYSGSDSLSFVNGSGRVYTFYGQGKQFDHNSKIIRGSVPADCEQPTISYEFGLVKFTSPDTLYRGIDFRLLRAEIPSYNSNGKWTINADYTLNFNYNFASLLNDSLYKDTVNIKGTNYKCIKLASDSGAITNALYFNHNYGILKLVLPQGQTWYRQ